MAKLTASPKKSQTLHWKMFCRSQTRHWTIIINFPMSADIMDSL